MRMTNKIMQNNSLYNINQTKVTEDKLNTQMTTQSKIARPSDDPVVAIRALRLRSSVTTIGQYYEKNAPDAKQWLTVTADSLSTITTVVTDLYKQAEKASDEELTAADLNVIFDQISELTDEVYATGNQDYAGRYIFTGYRTDTELTFKEDDTTPFTIKELLTIDDLSENSYTNYDAIRTTTGLEDPTTTEQDIKSGTFYRLRLSYRDLDSDTLSFSYTDKDGNAQTITAAPIDDPDTGYKQAIDGGAAAFLPKTGEVLLTKEQYESLKAVMDDGAEVEVEYGKSTWNKGDLNPVHYFDCTDTKSGIQYNAGGEVDTKITYDVGYNQQIQVNTNASEVFFHDFARDVDDLKSALAKLTELEELQTKVKNEAAKYEDESDPKYADLQRQLDTVNKAYSYVRDQVQGMFEHQMTKYQNYLDGVNLAITQNGTRSSRLELISDRLGGQKSTFKELQEDNEGIEMTEVAVQLASAELTYEAALQATSKIMQNSLMNYI